MRLFLFFLLCISLFFLLRHVRWWYVSDVERPQMNTQKQFGNMSIVDMPSQIVATVRTQGTLASSGNYAFRDLAWYIFWNNRWAGKIAMTAPVTSQKVSWQKIAMTAPVTSTEVDVWIYETSFSMPREWTMDTLPIPNNDKVVLKEIPASQKAVWYFDWYSTGDRVSEQWTLFQFALKSEWISWLGEPTLAQYNDPWTPPWMRRNELRVDLK